MNIYQRFRSYFIQKLNIKIFRKNLVNKYSEFSIVDLYALRKSAYLTKLESSNFHQK